jgi:eukaryotic-like serine/threonine-protein kinase
MSDPASEDFSSTEVKAGDVLAGKYRVDRVIGAGGMGVVVLATHTVLHDRVALKFLLPHVLSNPSVAARFLREAQSAVRIKSPHVARVIDVGTLETGSPFMVMEFLEGRDLGDLLAADGPLDTDVACVFALQACEALAAAHAAHVVHRDIKPANLFITNTADGAPTVKVLDFGISKSAGLDGQAALTQTQVSMGSPLYMSPEQMRSARDVDARADIWSLGVVLYEMLSGTLPFLADSMPQLCALVLENSAPPVRAIRPDVPEGLGDAVAKCLQKRVEDRFDNVADLAKALAPYAGDFGVASAARVHRILGGTITSKVDGSQVRAAMSSLHQSAVPTPAGANTNTSFGRTSSDAEPAPETAPKKAVPIVPIAVVGALVVAAAAGFALRGSGNDAAAANAPPPPASAAQTALTATATANETAAAAPSAAPSASAAGTAPEISPAKTVEVAAVPEKTAAPVRVPGPLPKPKEKDPKKDPPKSDVFGDRK